MWEGMAIWVGLGTYSARLTPSLPLPPTDPIIRPSSTSEQGPLPYLPLSGQAGLAAKLTFTFPAIPSPNRQMVDSIESRDIAKREGGQGKLAREMINEQEPGIPHPSRLSKWRRS